METLQVTAQGTHHSGTKTLILIVSVKEADGTPVEGLTIKNFTVHQMGAFFGDFSTTVFQDLDAFPELDGVYRLVRHDWAPAVDGTFCHHVRVARRPDSGSCLSSVVKLGGLID